VVGLVCLFVYFSIRYLKNWCSYSQQTWHRHVPWWVLETCLFWGLKTKVTTSVSVFRHMQYCRCAFVSHTGFSWHGFLHSCECRILLGNLCAVEWYFYGFCYMFRSLSTRIVSLHFQAWGRRRRPNLCLVCFVLWLCYLYCLVKINSGILLYLV